MSAYPQILPDYALAEIRAMVESSMVDMVEIWSPGSFNLDEQTLREHYAEGLLQWVGAARVTTTSGPREINVGEAVVAMRDADFLIPVDAPLPQRDFTVRVIMSEDPGLERRWFTITDVRVLSQQAARRFSAVQAVPQRQWNPDLDTTPNLSASDPETWT